MSHELIELRKYATQLEQKNRHYLEIIGGNLNNDPNLAKKELTSQELAQTKKLSRLRQADENFNDELIDILE